MSSSDEFWENNICYSDPNNTNNRDKVLRCLAQSGGRSGLQLIQLSTQTGIGYLELLGQLPEWVYRGYVRRKVAPFTVGPDESGEQVYYCISAMGKELLEAAW